MPETSLQGKVASENGKKAENVFFETIKQHGYNVIENYEEFVSHNPQFCMKKVAENVFTKSASAVIYPELLSEEINLKDGIYFFNLKSNKGITKQFHFNYFIEEYNPKGEIQNNIFGKDKKFDGLVLKVESNKILSSIFIEIKSSETTGSDCEKNEYTINFVREFFPNSKILFFGIGENYKKDTSTKEKLISLYRIRKNNIGRKDLFSITEEEFKEYFEDFNRFINE